MGMSCGNEGSSLDGDVLDGKIPALELGCLSVPRDVYNCFSLS